MTLRRPLALINGIPTTLPVGDTIEGVEQSGALIDGGDWATDHAGGLKIDFGSWA